MFLPEVLRQMFYFNKKYIGKNTGPASSLKIESSMSVRGGSVLKNLIACTGFKNIIGKLFWNVFVPSTLKGEGDARDTQCGLFELSLFLGRLDRGTDK